MDNCERYIKNASRGEFQWECDETTDGYGMGGVLVESVSLKGRSASIRHESDNEFEIDVILKNEVFYDNEKSCEIIEYRASRKSAREFAERWIKQDIFKDIQVTDKQLDLMKHALGLDYKKKPFRNRFFTKEDDKDWNDLVDKGLAVKSNEHTDDENAYFWLTKMGVEYVSGKSINDERYKEL